MKQAKPAIHGSPNRRKTNFHAINNGLHHPVYINTAQATAQNQFFSTNNFFIPDDSNRCIHEIRDKVFHAGYLENGNNAYLLELPELKDMLHTNKFLMDKMSGQFYAVYVVHQQDRLLLSQLHLTFPSSMDGARSQNRSKLPRPSELDNRTPPATSDRAQFGA